jgi:hypothetical protein
LINCRNFLKKIDIDIKKDIPIINEISSKITDTKLRMDTMVQKYKETERNIHQLANTLIIEIEKLDREEGGGVEDEDVEDEDVEDEVNRPAPPQVYGHDIISYLQKYFENDGKTHILLRIFENQKYLDFKKNILSINKIMDLIKKCNVYIDSYLSIAKYIALEKICNYLIRLYYKSGDTQDVKIIDGTEKLFRNLIKQNIIKDYHFNNEIDYSLLFFEGIEKTLKELGEEGKYARIAPITQKFKLTDEGEPVATEQSAEPDAEPAAAAAEPVAAAEPAAGGGKRRRLTNKKRNRRERTNKKRRSIRKTNRRNTKKERTPKKRILKTERTLKKNTLKKGRV